MIKPKQFEQIRFVLPTQVKIMKPNQRTTTGPTVKPLLVICVGLMFALLTFTGCKKDQRMQRHGPPQKENYIDSDITEFHNLGWLGVQTHPLTKSIRFKDPDDSDSTISPGGLVITNLFADSPAADSQLNIGDVIVGIDGKWLPIKDDPTLDFIRLLESSVAAMKETTELSVYDGRQKFVTIKNNTVSLEPTIDNQVPRYQIAHGRGLEHLAKQQNEDGSFGPASESSEQNLKQDFEADADFDQTLQTTCLAGMSLLTARDDQYQPNVDKCLEFVAQQIDAKIALAEKAAPKEDAKKKPATPGVVVMKMPKFELEPLTAAYVAQFLAESDVQMMDGKWMPRLTGTISSLSQSQHESGAWNMEEKTDGMPRNVAHTTHTTNQVLLAIGMLERKGVMGNPDTIKKACGYLKQAKEARAGTSIDRRLKNSLTAGTAAALMSVNCQTNDAFLKQAVEDGLSGAGECYLSPQFTLPGVFSTALLARQTGADAWEQFHNETKYWISSVQLPDGSFNSMPTGFADQDTEAERKPDSVWEAAHYCLLLAMQSDKLPKLKAKTKSPMQVARNSDGVKVEGSASGTPAIPGMPDGAKVMSFQMGDLSGEGSLEDQLKEKLKEMGIEGNIEIGSPGSAPEKDKK